MVLITGANGFIGQALCSVLSARDERIRRAVREQDSRRDSTGEESVVVGSIDGHTDWAAALRGVDTVVHLAARAHLVRESGSDLLSTYREVNTEGTRRLAEMASKAGVKRFVFLSSVKVNGERTSGRPFTENDIPQPEDAYGISKWEAEQALLNVAHATGMEAMILRPPLVYGPGVKGNFLRLMRLVAHGAPLPLASVANRRSLIHVDNLVDAIIACLNSTAVPGNTYLVSDGEDVSTPDLIRLLAQALGVPARLFPFPVALLKLGAAMLGKRGEIARLADSLQIHSSKIRNALGWRPRVSLAEGLSETARWYLKAVSGTPQRDIEKNEP